MGKGRGSTVGQVLRLLCAQAPNIAGVLVVLLKIVHISFSRSVCSAQETQYVEQQHAQLLLQTSPPAGATLCSKAAVCKLLKVSGGKAFALRMACKPSGS
jgi:hypothetical protein